MTKPSLPFGCCGYSPSEVDRIWGKWGSHYIPKAIFYLLKGDFMHGVYTASTGVLRIGNSGGVQRGFLLRGPSLELRGTQRL